MDIKFQSNNGIFQTRASLVQLQILSIAIVWRGIDVSKTPFRLVIETMKIEKPLQPYFIKVVDFLSFWHNSGTKS